jgi:hypothetical protein
MAVPPAVEVPAEVADSMRLSGQSMSEFGTPLTVADQEAIQYIFMNSFRAGLTTIL